MDATISHIFGEYSATSVELPVDTCLGQPYQNQSFDKSKNTEPNDFTTLEIEIYVEESGKLLATNIIPVNSTENLIGFSFDSFVPRLTPYAISLYGASPRWKANVYC